MLIIFKKFYDETKIASLTYVQHFDGRRTFYP